MFDRLASLLSARRELRRIRQALEGLLYLQARQQGLTLADVQQGLRGDSQPVGTGDVAYTDPGLLYRAQEASARLGALLGREPTEEEVLHELELEEGQEAEEGRR